MHGIGSLRPREGQRAGMQIGEKDKDHAQFLRAENDNTTPRTAFTLPPNGKGADLLFQITAAYAAGAMALKAAGGDAQLAERATTKAKELFKQAEAVPGLYSVTSKEAVNTRMMVGNRLGFGLQRGFTS
jgi:hypothetical protein